MVKLFSQDSYFVKMLELLVDLFILNMLFIMTSIPIFTIGAGLAGMSKVTQKIVRHERVNIGHTYFTEFKTSFKSATLVWLFVLGVGIVLLINSSFAAHANNQLIKGIVFIVFLLLLNLVTYVFSYMARYRDNLKTCLSNAWLLSLKYIVHTILCLIMNVCLIWFFIKSPVGVLTFVYFATFGGMAFWQLINSVIIVHVFNKVEKTGK